MAVDVRYEQSELTDKLIGAVFEAYNSLKFGYQEKYYQRAFAIELEKLSLPYVREQSLPLKYEQRIIGRYFIDFLVNNQVVVELKVANEILETHVAQVLGYLKAASLKVGLLFVITKDRVLVKRIVN
jgi:GxxExxY protein